MSKPLQNPIFDALFCDEEERFDDDDEEEARGDFNEIRENPIDSLFEHDLFWEDEEITTLLSKEKTQSGAINSDITFNTARNDAVSWVLRVVTRHGFAAATAALAVNYFDRFITSIFFQRDKPWMGQLAAVACVSLAAKMEETQVPLLLDLQVEESKYVFEGRTVQRMELLVLSTLQWRMNLVTPISFVDHIVRRFDFFTNLHSDFFRRCERVFISILTDCRLVHYLPSVTAGSIMKYVIGEFEHCDELGYLNQLMSVLRTTEEKIDDCYKLITELMDDDYGYTFRHKRKSGTYVPSSPSGVVDAYFSSDSSNDSWEVASSMTPSSSSLWPEPLFKRSRAH
ncbi:hypothetical protein ABFS83_12G016000 [Erythranthe nasuta]